MGDSCMQRGSGKEHIPLYDYYDADDKPNAYLSATFGALLRKHALVVDPPSTNDVILQHSSKDIIIHTRLKWEYAVPIAEAVINADTWTATMLTAAAKCNADLQQYPHLVIFSPTVKMDVKGTDIVFSCDYIKLE